MTNRRRAVKARTDTRRKRRAKPARQAGLVHLPVEPIAAFRGGSPGIQVARLGDPRLQTIQRQALAAQIGRRQGNRHLQRIIASVKGDARTAPYQLHTSKPPTGPASGTGIKESVVGSRPGAARKAGVTCPVQRQVGRARPVNLLTKKIWGRIPKWMRPRLNRSAVQQRVLLILYARIGPQLWRHIKEITYVGKSGVMDFKPIAENALRVDLKARGYTDAYLAKRGPNRWGLREQMSKGASLHWRGLSDGKVNVHIDLHPPKFTGFMHWFMDSLRRGSTHTPEKLQAGVERLGKDIPILSAGKKYEQLRIYFNNLEKHAQGRAKAKTAINRGRQHLLKAIACVMRKKPILEADLKKIRLHLRKAHLEAVRAAKLLRKPARK